MKTNQWEVTYTYQKTQRSVMILQYLKYSKCKTLDDLINLPYNQTKELLDDYMKYIMTINRDNVVRNKMYAIDHFYKVNGTKITLTGDLFEIPRIVNGLIEP